MLPVIPGYCGGLLISRTRIGFFSYSGVTCVGKSRGPDKNGEYSMDEPAREKNSLIYNPVLFESSVIKYLDDDLITFEKPS